MLAARALSKSSNPELIELARAVKLYCKKEEEYEEDEEDEEEVCTTLTLNLCPLYSRPVTMNYSHSVSQDQMKVVFPTIMHAFQAHKYPPDQWSKFENIRLHEASDLGRKASIDVKQWDQNKLTVMETIYKHYLDEYQDIMQRLISTHDHIFEDKVPGNFWSTTTYDEENREDNQIGHICMQLRQKLREVKAKRQKRQCSTE